jgi:hypothetical protein
MRLLCHIHYEIQGSTDTNRRPRKYAFKELVALDIPVVDEDAAPIAVEWTPDTESYGYGYEDRQMSGPDGRQLTRWHENSHWQRLCDGHFFGVKERGPSITLDDLQAMLADPCKNTAALAAVQLPEANPGNSKYKYAQVDRDPRSRFADIKMDGRDLVMQSFQKASSGLIIVNGQLHRKSIEPYISVELGYDRGIAVIKNVGIETTPGSLWGPSTKLYAVFGLGQMDRALTFITDPKLTDSGSDIRVPDVNVLREEALTYDWDISYKVAVAAKAAQNALSLFSRSRDLKLEEIIASQDAEEQHDILLSIDPSEPRWEDNELALRRYGEMVDILNNRTISMALPAIGSRP